MKNSKSKSQGVFKFICNCFSYFFNNFSIRICNKSSIRSLVF